MVGPFCGYVARTHPAPTRAQGKGMKPYIFVIGLYAHKNGQKSSEKRQKRAKMRCKSVIFWLKVSFQKKKVSAENPNRTQYKAVFVD